MSVTNKQLTTIIISSILIYVVGLLVTIFSLQGTEVISGLNIVTSFLILFYWVRKQFRILKHYFEFGEMAALGVEALVFGLSVYTVLQQQEAKWLVTAAYIVFGLHFTMLILALIFSLTFKIKKLF